MGLNPRNPTHLDTLVLREAICTTLHSTTLLHSRCIQSFAWKQIESYLCTPAHAHWNLKLAYYFIEIHL